MRQVTFQKHDFLRFSPGLVFLLNVFSVEPLANFVGWGPAAIIGGVNSGLIGLAALRWKSAYQLEIWEKRWLKMGCIMTFVFSIFLICLGIFILAE